MSSLSVIADDGTHENFAVLGLGVNGCVCQIILVNAVRSSNLSKSDRKIFEYTYICEFIYTYIRDKKAYTEL